MARTLVVVSLALVAGAEAQTLKIAVIDMQGALLATKEGQDAAAQLKTKFGPRQDEMTRRQQEIAAKQEALRKDGATMSPEARAAADREIQTMGTRLQRDADDAKADFQEEENRLLGGILGKMQAILNKYASDNALTMIVDLSQQPNNLLYAHESTNITKAVIDLYDKAPAGAAPAPSAGPAAKPPATARPTTTAAPPAAAPKPPAARPAGAK